MIFTWEPRKEGHSEWWFAWHPLMLTSRRPPYTRYFIWLQRVQRVWLMNDYGGYGWKYELPGTEVAQNE